jgi:predicted peptidase
MYLTQSTTIWSQDFNLFEKRMLKGAGKDSLPYRILFPASYDRTKKYPLVMVLHGGGERGNDNEKQLTHGAKLFLSENNRSRFPAIVVFPQCPEEQYWSSVNIDRTKMPLSLEFDYETAQVKWPLAMTLELIAQLKKEEGVESSRVYITGLSMGGMGTFEAVYRYPDVFAAALPVCGGGDALHYDKRVNKIPFWIFHGDQDAVVDVKNSRTMVERLKQLNVNVKYTEYPAVNHNSWDNAFAEPDFLSWMFSMKK